MQTAHPIDVLAGIVRWSPVNSLWWSAMALATLIGGVATFST